MRNLILVLVLASISAPAFAVDFNPWNNIERLEKKVKLLEKRVKELETLEKNVESLEKKVSTTLEKTFRLEEAFSEGMEKALEKAVSSALGLDNKAIKKIVIENDLTNGVGKQ